MLSWPVQISRLLALGFFILGFLYNTCLDASLIMKVEGYEGYETCTQLRLKKSPKWAIKYFSQMKRFNFLGYIYWRVFISQSLGTLVLQCMKSCYGRNSAAIRTYESLINCNVPVTSSSCWHQRHIAKRIHTCLVWGWDEKIYFASLMDISHTITIKQYSVSCLPELACSFHYITVHL